MKFVPNAITATVGRALLKSQKNSPQMLFVAGVVGVSTTVVLACKATLRVDAVLDACEKDLEKARILHDGGNLQYTETNYRKDCVYIKVRTGVSLCKLYAPSIIVGIGSVSALAGAQHILNKRNAAITAAYAVVEKSFADYRKRVIDEYGEDKEREFYRNLEACEIDDEDHPGKKKTVLRPAAQGHSMYARFFDRNSSSWSQNPEYNVVFLRVQQNYVNQLLQSRGHVFLNEVYDLLGIERTKEGAVVGWLKDNEDGYIDFGIFDSPSNQQFFDFVTGQEEAVLLDFNVDGIIYDRI